MRSRAHLNALPGQPKKATPLLPALHARADGAAIDAAFDAEAAVLAEWLLSEQELRTPPPLPPCGAQDPARRRAVTGPRRRRAVKHSAAVRSAVNDAGLEQVPRHAPPVALCCALVGQMADGLGPPRAVDPAHCCTARSTSAGRRRRSGPTRGLRSATDAGLSSMATAARRSGGGTRTRRRPDRSGSSATGRACPRIVEAASRSGSWTPSRTPAETGQNGRPAGRMTAPPAVHEAEGAGPELGTTRYRPDCET